MRTQNIIISIRQRRVSLRSDFATDLMQQQSSSLTARDFQKCRTSVERDQWKQRMMSRSHYAPTATDS